MDKSRDGGVAALRDSVDLAKAAKLAESPDVDSQARRACQALSSEKTLVGLAECAEYGRVLGFDARKLCAAHNFVVVSKHADSIRISTLAKVVEGLASPDEVEGLLAEAISQPQSALSGALIDEVAGIVRFRPHALRNRQWAESVYRSL